MALAPHPDNLYLGKGKIYFDKKDSSGNPTGLMMMGNCDTLSITTLDDTLSINSSMDESAGTLKKVTRKRNMNLNIHGNEFNADILSIVMMGESDFVVQTGGAKTDEALTGGQNVKLGRYYRTAERNISAVTVKQGATTLVADTDYTIVDAKAGLIFFPTTGAADDAQPATIDYTSGAITSGQLPRVKGGTKSLVEGELLFIGDAQAGPDLELHVWSVSMTPNGELGLITSDWGAWTLNGEVQDDSINHPGNQYYELLERGVDS